MMRNTDPILLRGRPLVCDGGPFIFGVLNVTPDSFSDGGRYLDPDDAVAAGCRMAEDGVDVIDVGGESTRPGSDPVSADEQISRTRGVIAALARRFGREGPAISIDTRLAPVARAAVEAGAVLINDVSALRDDAEMAAVVAESRAGVVLMHMLGTPATMQEDPVYDDVIDDVKAFLAKRVAAAVGQGIKRGRIVVDPGIGFGKTTAHNLAILADLWKFRELGLPVMVGPSRKRFIGEVLSVPNATDRLAGTLGAVALCARAGIECIRVHDVGAARQVAALCAAVRRAGNACDELRAEPGRGSG